MSETEVPKEKPADDQHQSPLVKDVTTENNDNFMEKFNTIFDQLHSQLETIVKSSDEFNAGQVTIAASPAENESKVNGKQDECMQVDENVATLPNFTKDEILKESESVQKDVQIQEQEPREDMQVQNEEQDKKEESVNNQTDVNEEHQKLCYEWTKPKLVCKASKEFKPSESCENFTKGCHWSPDGTCILVPSEDFRIRIFELPRDLYSGVLPKDFQRPDFESTLKVKEGGTIYDTHWFPYMNSWDPSTCCFLSTSQGSPVHLWDAFTGQLRATYRAYNLVDEVEAAISVQFTDSGGQIWSGFKNALRIFDTDRPGRQIQNIFLKKQFPNVTGLVSCIRENPLMPGLIAFGTYSKCIGLYKDGPICAFKTGSGVTQIEFSPCGTKLYSAVRRDGEFLCWDLRNPGTVLYSLDNRQADTNQRIWFNLSYSGAEVVSGGTDGLVRVWNVDNHLQEDEDVNSTYDIKVSKDCVNGVNLHKNLPILAVSTGERKCDDEGSNIRDNSLHLYWLSGR